MSQDSEYRIVPSFNADGSQSGYYTREPDGVSGMSVSALSSLCGLASGSTTAISNLLARIESEDPETNTLPESLKSFAGKDLRLETNDLQGIKIIPDEACYAVLEYYALDARAYAGQDTAKTNYRMTGRAGMRVFIWSKTGYVPELLRESLRSNTTTYIERLENIRDHQIDDDMWSAFREGAEILLLVEKEMGVPVDQMDLCDGSIGSHWRNYRKDKPWIEEVGSYIHVFKDQRGPRECNAYDLSELSYFRKWLREIYIPTHLPKYLTDKFGKRAALEIYQSIGGVTPLIQEITKMTKQTDKQNALYENYQKLRQQLLKVPISQEQLELIDENE